MTPAGNSLPGFQHSEGEPMEILFGQNLTAGFLSATRQILDMIDSSLHRSIVQKASAVTESA